MKTSFYSEEELATLGLKSYGKNVLISRHACLYSPETISIGNNVRIDDKDRKKDLLKYMQV